MTKVLTRRAISLHSSDEIRSLVMNKNGVLVNEEGPVYDVLRLNTMGCQSIEVDGVKYVVERDNNDLGDMANPTILHPDLAALADKPALGITVKRKIPKKNLMEARAIMQLVYDKHKTEVMVFILFNKRTGEFTTTIPKQEVSSAACTVQAEDSVEQQSADVIMAADFHSHPFGGGHGFLSGTDHDNHDSYPDVPIASFNFSGTPVVGSLYNFGVLKCEFGEIPLEMEDFCETPDEVLTITQADHDKWDALIEEKVHTRTYTTSYGSYGSGYDYWTTKAASSYWRRTDDEDGFDEFVPGIPKAPEAAKSGREAKSGHGKRGRKKSENKSSRGTILSTTKDGTVWVNGKKVGNTWPDYVDLGEMYRTVEDVAKELWQSNPLMTAEQADAFRSGYDTGFDDPFLDEQVDGMDLTKEAEDFLKYSYMTGVPGSYLAVDEWPKVKQRDVDAIVILLDNNGLFESEDIDKVKYPTLYGFLNEIEKSPTARNRLMGVPKLYVAALFGFGTVANPTAAKLKLELQQMTVELAEDAATADAIHAAQALAEAKKEASAIEAQGLGNDASDLTKIGSEDDDDDGK